MKISKRNIWLHSFILGASFWTTSAAIAGPSSTTCIVDNTLDTNASLPPVTGSLRDCMTRARSGDTITFDSNIFDLTNSDAATTIGVQGQLPALDDGNVTIDASDRRVTINGSAAGNSVGLDITSSNNQVVGLTIVGFSSSGIRITDAASNIIGGPRSTGIGPNGQGMRISACGSFGIEISGSGSTGNVVKGCWIGLDASGETPMPNLAGVIVQSGAHANTIGSVIGAEANVISGNTFEGITISDTATDDNVVIGNVIGTTGAIDAPIPGRTSTSGNGSAGVFLSRGTQGSTVGGSDPGAANVIAFNGGNGVEVRAPGSRRNSVTGNRIGRNVRGGIALFDGSNDAIRPPDILSVQELGVGSTGSGVSLRFTGTTPLGGSIEVFNDPADQGATFLGRKDVLSGAWTTDVDGTSGQNLSATLTDDLGNTSRFGVFGLTSVDTDDDGVSDVIEALAETDPADSTDTPTLLHEALSVSKMSIKLNFKSSGRDSLKFAVGLTLPPGFTADSSRLGVYVAGHSDHLNLDSDGHGSSANSKVLFKTSSMTGPVVKYGIKLAPLNGGLETSGISEKTTTGDGERWVLPVAVTLGSSVAYGTVTVTYKATQGKSGKASLSK